jgi:hypothetical protein
VEVLADHLRPNACVVEAIGEIALAPGCTVNGEHKAGRRAGAEHVAHGRKNDQAQCRRGHPYREVPALGGQTYIGFNDESCAIAFEKYLKAASGRAFAKKRL